MYAFKIATLIATALGLAACDGEPIDNIDQEAPLTKILQAERYTYVEGEVELGDGGKVVHQFNNKEYLHYPAVNLDGVKRITVNYASDIENGAIEFRLGAPDGELIAFIDLPSTGSWQNFAEVYGDITGEVTGQHALYVVARNTSKEFSSDNEYRGEITDKVAGNIDYFTFSTESSPTRNVEYFIEENTLGFCDASGVVQSEYEGAGGEGYINTNVFDRLAFLTWKVKAPRTGVYKLRFRYADTSEGSRQAVLILNHSRTQELTFETTGEWSNWQYLDVKAPLHAGDNTIQLTSITATVESGLPNIDNLTIIGSEVLPVSCGREDRQPFPPYDFRGHIDLGVAASGWASMNGGTGGDFDQRPALNMSDLQAAVAGSEPRSVWLLDFSSSLDSFNGTLHIGSNKMIIGAHPGITLTGNIVIAGSNNVVLHALSVRGNPCDTAEECKEGEPAVYIGDGASNIWLNHLDIADGQNGNLRVTNEADFITISKSKFHYTDDRKRQLASQVTRSDNETQPSIKSRITYMHNWWGPGTGQDLPNNSFSNIHMFNNYFNTGGSEIHHVGSETSFIAENNYYEEPNSKAFTDSGSGTGWLGRENEGNAREINTSSGSVFNIPYSYSAMPASAVKPTVTSSKCGAGNVCLPPG